MQKSFPRLRLLSSPTQLLTRQDLTDLVLQGMEARQMVLGHINLHGAAILRRLPAVREFLESVDYAYMDGMPFVWLAWLCGFPASRSHRNTGLDWIPTLLEELGRRQRSVFFVGGNPETADKVGGYLTKAYPGLRSTAHHGYLSTIESTELIDLINSVQPDLLLLGMGMPRQELWLLNHRHRLRFGVALPAGAILEYYVGSQKPPSRVSGRLGLEWLVRLWNEPRRLGPRYLIEPWALILPALRDIWHYRVGRGRSEVNAFKANVAGSGSLEYNSEFYIEADQPDALKQRAWDTGGD
jgi:N-acetylglucosaminyldiphosphoundecaprenol N-acetyl-beta-D-mannosaminyltransferase